MRPATDVLIAQCELWRVILTGEKRATELLEPLNYIAAAEMLAVKLRNAATLVLKQYAISGVVVLTLIVLGLAILVFSHGLTKAAAGLSGILLALGLTWKGIGTTMGRLASQLEGPLWGAELDMAITEAVTLGVHPTPPPNVRGDLKSPSRDYAQRTKRRPGIDPADPPA